MRPVQIHIMTPVQALIFVWCPTTQGLVPWTGKAKEPSAVN